MIPLFRSFSVHCMSKITFAELPAVRRQFSKTKIKIKQYAPDNHLPSLSSASKRQGKEVHSRVGNHVIAHHVPRHQISRCSLASRHSQTLTQRTRTRSRAYRRGLVSGFQPSSMAMSSAARSPMASTVTMGLMEGMSGKTPASAMRSLPMPRTLSLGSTTA